MASCTKKQGAWLDNGVPVRNGLVAEYRFDECRNLLKYSQQFDNAVWTKAFSTATGNETTAPDGTTTAESLMETADNNFHYLQFLSAPTPSTVSTASIFAKANGRTKIRLAESGNARGGYYNLSTGVCSAYGAGVTFSMQNVGNGWYRCSFTSAFSAAGKFTILICDGANETYVGDITKGVYLWGAQLEVGSAATTYVPTTNKQTLTDYSGNANHGTLGSTAGDDTNDPTWTAEGVSITTDDYMSLPNLIPGATAVTIMQVCRTTTTVPHAGIFGSSRMLASHHTISLIDSSNGGSDADEIYISASDGTNVCHLHASKRLTSSWEVLTTKFIGSASLSARHNLGSWTTETAGVIASIAVNPTALTFLGRYSTAYRTGGDGYLVVYNRALTDTEIAKNYAYLKSYLLKNRGIALP